MFRKGVNEVCVCVGGSGGGVKKEVGGCETFKKVRHIINNKKNNASIIRVKQ